MKKIIVGLCTLGLFLPSLTFGAETVKVGMITTLSTKAGYLGEEIRDGFKLAMDKEGGKLGGTAVELLVEDDEGKPEKGKQIATRFQQKDGVKIMTGIVFSNVAMAVVPKLVEDDVLYLSANAGPSQYAGAQCNPYFFSASYQNDNMHEAVGQTVQDKGFKKVALIAPNYPAGKDALTGFKRYFK